MRIVLADFTCYFTLNGSSGALHSREVEFKLPKRRDGTEEMKEAMRSVVQTHTEVLDRFYADVVPGKREPILIDALP